MAIVYVTTNLLNGKKYLGKHHDDSSWYLGSGVLIKRAIKKYGKDNFARIILHSDLTLEQAAKIEYELSILWDVVHNYKWYNMKNGGIGGSKKNRILSETTKEKISASKKGQPSWNTNLYGDPRLKHSDMWKKNHSNKLKGIDYKNQGENHSSSKTVIFTDMFGKEYVVTGIRQFCRNNGLNFNIMIGRLRKGKFELFTDKHPWRIRYA